MAMTSDSIARPALSKSLTRTALVWAVAWCLSASILAALAGYALPSSDFSEKAVLVLLFPLTQITAVLSALIDLIGPANRSEPASHFLSPVAVRALAVFAFVIYFALLFFIARLIACWQERRRHLGPAVQR